MKFSPFFFFLLVFTLLFSLSSISADIYDNCEIYGNCEPVGTNLVEGVNYSINTNNSDYWAGNAYVVGGVSSIETDPVFTAASGAYNSHIAGTGTAVHGDSFLLNTGDTATGDYTFDTSTLHIDSTNHKVGIGTTAPFDKLTVGTGAGSFKGTTDFRTTGKTLTISSGDLSVLRFSSSFGGADGGDSAFIMSELVSNNNNNLIFGKQANNEVSFTEWMRIDESGNVGIGTTSPTEKLDVNGSIRQNDNQKIYQGTSDDVSIEYNSTGWNFLQEVGAGIWNFNTNGGIINLLSNTKINGDLNVTGNFYSNNSIGITGNYTNGNCWNLIEQGIIKSTNCTSY